MHDLTALLIELGGVLLALGILGRIAGRVGFSPIPLYLLAGLAFGHGGLLPLDESEEFVATGAEIGVILLLLLLGLEYTAADLVRQGCRRGEGHQTVPTSFAGTDQTTTHDVSTSTRP